MATQPTKSAAQLQQEADAQRQREEEARAAQDQQRQSWMSSIFGGLFGDGGFFSFGNLLMMGLMVTGIYFLAKTEFGQDLIHKITGNFSPETQAKIAGFMNMMGIETDMSQALTAMPLANFQNLLKEQNVPQEMIDVIAPTEEAKSQFLQLVASANGGKVTPAAFTNDKTIFALCTQDPTRCKALAAAAMRGAQSGDGKLSPTATNVLTSLRTMITDGRIDTLLNDANRANTITILQGMIPLKNGAPQVSATQLNALIAGGMQDGHTTPEFRALLTNLLTPDADGKLPEPTSALASNPAVSKSLIDATLAQAVADLKAATPQHPASLSTQFLGNNDGKAITAMRAQLNDDNKLIAFGTAAASNDRVAMLKFFFENPEAIKAYAANSKDLPAEINQPLQQFLQQPASSYAPILNILNKGIDPIALASNFMVNDRQGKPQFSPDKAIDALLNPAVRGQLKQAGTDNIAVLMHDQNHFATKKNLDALLIFSGEISASPANMGTHLPQTKQLLHAFVKLATPGVKPADALKGISAQQLSEFFKNPANHDAMVHLLRNVDQSTLSNTQKLVINTLYKDMGNPAKGVGLSSILADKDGAQLFLDSLTKPQAHNWLTSITTDTDWVQDLGLAFGFAGGKSTTAALGQQGVAAAANRDILMDLKHLNIAIADASVAPAPTTTPRNAQTVRAHG